MSYNEILYYKALSAVSEVTECKSPHVVPLYALLPEHKLSVKSFESKQLISLHIFSITQLEKYSHKVNCATKYSWL